MSDPVVEVRRRSDIVRRLEQRYPALPEHAALEAVIESVRAVTTLGLDDDVEADRMVAVVAERRLRQQLGLESMDARLDPQPHRRERQVSR